MWVAELVGLKICLKEFKSRHPKIREKLKKRFCFKSDSVFILKATGQIQRFGYGGWVRQFNLLLNRHPVKTGLWFVFLSNFKLKFSKISKTNKNIVWRFSVIRKIKNQTLRYKQKSKCGN